MTDMEKLKKTEVINAVSEASSVSKADVARVLDAAASVLEGALKRGNKVPLLGGTFSARERGARKGVKPGTGEAIDIAASRSAGFSPGAALKAALNEK